MFEEFCSFQNLYLASQSAQKGKRYKEGTAVFNFDLENNLLYLQKELQKGQYQFGNYVSFYVHDPKTRFISAAPYQDRVVHHAVCNIIDPLFEKTFVFDLYSNRKDKGTHKAVDRYQKFCRLNEYVLKCDICKYFASIDKHKLFEVIQRKIKDKRLLAVIKEIIWSYAFNGDTGLPLGNLTSQLFANIYLSGMDHFVKEELKCGHYIRYVDDFVIFDKDKQRLHTIKQALQVFLAEHNLKLHPDKTQIRKVSEGVRFLGYKIFPEYRLVDKANVKRFKSKLRKYQKQYSNNQISLHKIFESMQSWNAHAGHADSYKMRKELFDKYAFSRCSS